MFVVAESLYVPPLQAERNVLSRESWNLESEVLSLESKPAPYVLIAAQRRTT